MTKLILFVIFVWVIVVEWQAHRAGWVVADIIGGVLTGGLFTFFRGVYLLVAGGAA